MTFFEFLAAAARAGIVAADLGRVALDLIRRSVTASLIRCDELLPALLAFDLFFLLFLFDRLKKEQEAERIFLDAIHQVFEKLVRLLFVFDQRIALTIAAQPD